ncbi:MAG: T9SS type A sorting domain-containing protein [candidate division Zixibacteria bacterium]|nr:T9SS type A sorting domain-containing protein [candidate division Zixibacteria bacterium]
MLNAYRLPPVPPAGMFDARFSDDYFLTETEEAEIHFQSQHFPLAIRLGDLSPENGAQFVLKEMIGDKEVSQYIVKTDQEILITNPQVKSLKLNKLTAAPFDFSLEQNYPNPFNPTTDIRFTLPQAETVAIIIYNALGQKVKTLVNSRREAGFHTVAWDATNDFGEPVSSGIYLYRISAGQYSELKKMIFLK